jgi:hypothetical protein
MKLLGTGFAFPVKGFDFEPNCDYRACLICGAVFQSWLDRHPVAPLKSKARRWRQEWADNHSKKHSRIEHERLRASGMSMTPTAANKLAAFGLIPISDMFELSVHQAIAERGELAAALLESTPIPIYDAETEVR